MRQKSMGVFMLSKNTHCFSLLHSSAQEATSNWRILKKWCLKSLRKPGKFPVTQSAFITSNSKMIIVFKMKSKKIVFLVKYFNSLRAIT